MKNQKYRKLLASVLVCSMILGNVPAAVYAESDVRMQEVQEQQQEEASVDTEGNGNVVDSEKDKDENTAGSNESVETPTNDATGKVTEGTQSTEQKEASQDAKSSDAAQSADTAPQSMSATQADTAEKTLEIHATDAVKGAGLLSKFNEWFGTATKYRYTQGEKQAEVSALNALTDYHFSAGSMTVEKYVNKGSVFKPKYVWETAGSVTVKIYYNVTFSITDLTEAGVQMDGADVTGTVKVYSDESKTFTVKQIEGYTTTVKTGETVMNPEVDGTYKLSALTADTTISVVYEASEGVNIYVTTPSNGSIQVNGQTADRIRVGLNESYNVSAVPESGYAVENILVNGTPVENVTYQNQTATVTLNSGAVNDAEIQVTAETVACNLDAADAEVSYREGMSMDKVTQNIFDAVMGTESVPEVTLNNLTIEYDASLTGLGNWKALGYQPEWYEPTLHSFGKSTEKIRITYPGTEKYPSMSKTVTITLKDLREATTVSVNDGIMMKYQSTEMMDAVIRVLIAQNATVTDAEGNVIDTTADDFSYTPATDEWSAGEQEITVTYNGNDDYLSSSTTTVITIKKGDASVWVNSQNIKYGESFSQVFAADPADAVPIGMIVGIDGNGKTFVGFDVSNVVIKQQIPVIGTTIEIPLENAILTLVPSGKVKIGNLMTIINKLPNLGDNAGVISAVQKIVDAILKIYPAAADFEISFKRPTESGVYLAVGASTSQNYETAVGVGYLTIAPQTENVKLEFNNPLPEGCTLTYQEAQNFGFGGKAVQNGQTVTANVKAKYSGVANTGEVITCSEEPLREPGSYIETIYTIGGNYVAEPVIRCYTVKRAETEIRFDGADADNIYTVPYDGNPHGVTAGVYSGEERIAEASIIYMSSSGYKSEIPPTETGMYQVMASYAGSDKYKCIEAVYARLFIVQKEVTVTPDSCGPVYYRDTLPEFTYTVTDANENVLSAEEIATLGTISVVKTDPAETAGFYTLTTQIENANKNYKINCVDRTFEIRKRPVTVQTDSLEMTYGDTVPSVTYTVYDMDGTVAAPEKVNVAEDFPSLTFGIEGQEEEKYLAANQAYAITATGLENENFEVTYTAGTLTVQPRKLSVTIDPKQKTEGEEDPELTYVAARVTDEVTAQAAEENALVDGDELGITLTREAGEEPGFYDIYVNTAQMNSNYVLAQEPDGADKFEIVKKATDPDDNKPITPEEPDKNPEEPDKNPDNKDDENGGTNTPGNTDNNGGNNTPGNTDNNGGTATSGNTDNNGAGQDTVQENPTTGDTANSTINKVSNTANTAGSTTESKGVNTGDTSNVVMYLCMMAIALVAVAAGVIFKRRYRKQ